MSHLNLKKKSSIKMEIAKVNAIRQKKTERGGRLYPACLVCGRLCLFRHYYGVICCEGCKKFFHRNASQDSSAPQCVNDSPCDVTKVKCRYCRYQKCLLVGMDPTFGKVKSAEKLDRFIDSSKRIEQQFKRIWDSTRPLPEAYTNRHETLAGLLQDNFNLLTNADQFPEEPFGCWNKAQFIEDVETNGLFGLHALNLQFVKDWFLLVELAKTFPFIKKLEPNDQICHLKHVDLPARFLISSFYSYLMNAKCHTRKNGLEIPAVLDVKQIHGDQRIRTLLIQKTCNLVDKMSKTDVNYEEFLLLLTILLSNSNADGLSPIGRKQLYNESVNYSKTLQNMLQCKFGPIGGAQKFVSLMDVLNLSIGIKFKYLEMIAYMEVFYTKCALNSAYPKIMHSI